MSSTSSSTNLSTWDLDNVGIVTIWVGVLLSVVSNMSFGAGIGDVSCYSKTKFSPSRYAFGIWLPVYLFSILMLWEQHYDVYYKYGKHKNTWSNILYGTAWVMAALWTPFFTIGARRNKIVPWSVTVAAALLTLCAGGSLAAVIVSDAWSSVGSGMFMWCTGTAYSLLGGWTLVAAMINIVIAYKAVFNITPITCEPEDNELNIQSPVDPEYATPVPFLLSLIVFVISIAKPDPILPVPLMWGTAFMKPSFINRITFVLLFIGVEIAFARLIL